MGRYGYQWDINEAVYHVCGMLQISLRCYRCQSNVMNINRTLLISMEDDTDAYGTLPVNTLEQCTLHSQWKS